MPRTTTHRILIRRNLVSRLFERRGGGGEPSNKDFEREAGLPPGLLSVLGALEPRQTPTLEQLGGLGRAFRIPPWSLLDRETDPWLLRHRNVCWRLAGDTAGVREQALRVAAAGAVLGCEPVEIGERILLLRRSHDPGACAPAIDELRRMARSGLALGAVTLVPSERGGELEDAELAAQLTAGLRAVAPPGVTPTARVVQSVAHPDFGGDPAAPLLVAHVAHGWIAQALASPSSPNGPDGPRALTLGPREGRARRDVRAGNRPRPLPASRRRRASLDRFPSRIHRAATAVRARPKPSSTSCAGGSPCWMRRTKPARRATYSRLPRRRASSTPRSWAATMRPAHALGPRERALIRGARLALLVTSGEANGAALTAVVRAGGANAVICDQAAAHAALAALSSA